MTYDSLFAEFLFLYFRCISLLFRRSVDVESSQFSGGQQVFAVVSISKGCRGAHPEEERECEEFHHSEVEVGCVVFCEEVMG